MTQLDRIEDRVISIDDRLRAVEQHVAENRGEKRGTGRAVTIIRHAVSAAIALVGGAVGSHLPGAH
jgi:hypothetical protein